MIQRSYAEQKCKTQLWKSTGVTFVLSENYLSLGNKFNQICDLISQNNFPLRGAAPLATVSVNSLPVRMCGSGTDHAVAEWLRWILADTQTHEISATRILNLRMCWSGNDHAVAEWLPWANSINFGRHTQSQDNRDTNLECPRGFSGCAGMATVTELRGAAGS